MPPIRATLVAFLLGTVLVVVCYFFVDRPVAYAAHGRDHYLDAVLKVITFVPSYAQAWVPAVLLVLAVRRAWGPWRRCELALLTACVCVLVADQCRGSMGYVAGRYWPETWVEDNPSLIRDGAAGYGFNPLEGSRKANSFPSGHMARTLAFVTVFGIAYPWARGLGVIAAVTEAAGLIGMNYHFVGDVVGGSFLGAIVGLWGAYLAGVNGAPVDRSGGAS